VEIAQQIENEQDDQHEPESASTASCAAIGVAASSEEDQQHDDNDDERHEIGTSLDADENAGSAVIMVPVAAMAVVMDEGVMVMLAVEPTLVVVIISQCATGADGEEENGDEGGKEVFW
jgi:hypothetical protein